MLGLEVRVRDGAENMIEARSSVPPFPSFFQRNYSPNGLNPGSGAAAAGGERAGLCKGKNSGRHEDASMLTPGFDGDADRARADLIHSLVNVLQRNIRVRYEIDIVELIKA